MIGIFREEVFSPNRVEDDAAILELTAEAVRRQGYQVDLMQPHEVTPKTPPRTTFTMCRGPSILNTLGKWEAMGHTIINSPRAVHNCYRYRTVHLLSQTGVPVPKTLVIQTSEKLNGQFDNMEGGVWVKRGDVHKTQEDDVQLIFDRSSLEKVFESFRSRWVKRAVLQEHISGDLIKFYGIVPLGWFRCFYHTPGQTSGHSFFVDQIRKTAEMAASKLGLQVYGGDIVVAEDGHYLVDINNWPSFAMCREEAAEEIASYLILAAQRWNSHPDLEWKSA